MSDRDHVNLREQSHLSICRCTTASKAGASPTEGTDLDLGFTPSVVLLGGIGVGPSPKPYIGRTGAFVVLSPHTNNHLVEPGQAGRWSSQPTCHGEHRVCVVMDWARHGGSTRKPDDAVTWSHVYMNPAFRQIRLDLAGC